MEVKVLRRFAACLVMLAALAPEAWAVKAAVSVTAHAYRNFSSAAVHAVVIGDDDSTTVCRIFQRRNGVAAFDTGMVMQRRPSLAALPLGRTVYDGRILWASVGDTVDYYVEAEDDSAGTRQRVRSAVDTVSVMGVPQFVPGGFGNGTNEWYVDGVNGNDAWDATQPVRFGATTTGPRKTITAGLSQMNTQGAPDGSTLHIADGEYHEQVIVSTWQNGIHWRLLGASRDSTIICGANPNVENGTYDGVHPIVWVDAGWDSIFKCYYPAGNVAAGINGPADSTQLYVLGFGELLHKKTSVVALGVDSSGATGSFANPPVKRCGEASGWTWQNDTLYVKRASGIYPNEVANFTAPSVTQNHFGYRDDLLWLKSRNIYVSTLTVRYAGSLRNDNLNTDSTYQRINDGPGHNGVCQAPNGPCLQCLQRPPLNGRLITLNDPSTSASGAVLYNLHLYGSNSQMVDNIRWFAGNHSDSVTVAYCLFDGLRLGTMPYSAGKARTEELVDGAQQQTMLDNFTHNTVVNTFNGFAQGASNDSTFGSFGEVSYNKFDRLADAAIDPSSSSGLNMLFMKNDIRYATSGFSNITSQNEGPYYVFFNTIATKDRGVKEGNTGGAGVRSTPVVVFAHNIFYRDPVYVGTGTGDRSMDAVTGAAPFQYYVNNLFVSTTAVPVPIQGFVVADTAGVKSGMGVGPCGFCFDGTGVRRDTIGTVGTYGAHWHMDYNAYALASGSNIGNWQSADRTIGNMTNLYDFELHGVQSTTALLHLASPSTYNFRLTKATNLTYVDKGRRLTGINAAWGVSRYTKFPGGSVIAPDVGAYEFSAKKHRPWWRRWYQHS
jgi:hypothetical protein